MKQNNKKHNKFHPSIFQTKSITRISVFTIQQSNEREKKVTHLPYFRKQKIIRTNQQTHIPSIHYYVVQLISIVIKNLLD